MTMYTVLDRVAQLIGISISNKYEAPPPQDEVPAIQTHADVHQSTEADLRLLLPHEKQLPPSLSQREPRIQQRVFNIFELAEKILLYIAASNPRTVLAAQRVSKDWQAVIQDSTPLQQALWFKPCPKHLHELKQCIRAGNFNPNDPAQFNPVIWPVPPAKNIIRATMRQVRPGRFGCESWRKMLVAALDIPTTKLEVHTSECRFGGISCDVDTTMGELFDRVRVFLNHERCKRGIQKTVDAAFAEADEV